MSNYINTLNNIKETDPKKFNLIIKMLGYNPKTITQSQMICAPVIDLKTNTIYKSIREGRKAAGYKVGSSIKKCQRLKSANDMSYTELHAIVLGKNPDYFTPRQKAAYEAYSKQGLENARKKEVIRSQQAKVAIDALGLDFDSKINHRDTRYNTAFWVTKDAKYICQQLWPNIAPSNRTKDDKHQFAYWAQATINITKDSKFCLEISPTQTHRERASIDGILNADYRQEAAAIKASCDKQHSIVTVKRADGTYPTYHNQVFMWLSTLLATPKGRALIGSIIDDMHKAGFTNYDDYRVWKYPESIVYYEPASYKTTIKYVSKATEAKAASSMAAEFDKMNEAALKKAYAELGAYLKKKGIK